MVRLEFDEQQLQEAVVICSAAMTTGNLRLAMPIAMLCQRLDAANIESLKQEKPNQEKPSGH